MCISIWSILGMQVHFTLLSLDTVQVQVPVMQVQVPINEHCCSRRQNLLVTISLHSNLNRIRSIWIILTDGLGHKRAAPQ